MHAHICGITKKKKKTLPGWAFPVCFLVYGRKRYLSLHIEQQNNRRLLQRIISFISTVKRTTKRLRGINQYLLTVHVYRSRDFYFLFVPHEENFNNMSTAGPVFHKGIVKSVSIYLVILEVLIVVSWVNARLRAFSFNFVVY